MKIVIAQLNPTVGDLKGNTHKVIDIMEKAKQAHADLVLFSEMVLSGYPPEDLLMLPQFIQSSQDHLQKIIQVTQGITAIVGLPRMNPHTKEKILYNSAAIIQNGVLLGYHDKILLPTYDVFDERRYFEPGAAPRLWEIAGKKVGITICEDIWQHSDLVRFTYYERDPVTELAALKPDLVVNLSSSPYSIDKPGRRIQVGRKAAITMNCPLALCNQVGGNDSLIFDGFSYYLNEAGELLQLAKGYKEETLYVDTEKTYVPLDFHNDSVGDMYKALVLGLKDYMGKSGFKKACIGLSGGIDSAVVACLAVAALGSENVLGISMPSRFSSEHSKTDAEVLARNLDIKYSVIPIEDPFTAYLDLLIPHFENKPPDVTEENMQARVRGIILMAMSNKFGYIVLSTGNKSENAMGYATLYGDMCGGLSVISDVTKMQVYALADYINKHKEIIPRSSIEKPPSAELKPDQKDSDTLPEYSILDTVLQEYVENYLTAEEIAQKHDIPLTLTYELIKKIHNNEYKRRQAAPTLRITEKAFTSGRRFPIVQHWER